jgi:hypothetical protein
MHNDPLANPEKIHGEWDYRTRIIPLLSSMKPGNCVPLSTVAWYCCHPFKRDRKKWPTPYYLRWYVCIATTIGVALSVIHDSSGRNTLETLCLYMTSMGITTDISLLFDPHLSTLNPDSRVSPGGHPPHLLYKGGGV